MSGRMLLLALLSAIAMVARGDDTVYVAPLLTDNLDPSSQSYLIGIISFIIFLSCIVMAVGALTGIDYSGDSLLNVDVEATHEE